MKHQPRQAALVLVALVIVSLAAPSIARANHNTPPRINLPGAPIGIGEHRQVLRPTLQGEIDLESLPSYRISATVDLTTATIQGEQHLSFTNPAGEPLDRLVFRLLPNADTIYGGGSLTIAQVVRGG